MDSAVLASTKLFAFKINSSVCTCLCGTAFPKVILSLSGSGQLKESESVKSQLEGPIVNPAGKKPSSSNFLIPISGIITLIMKRKVLLNQGTIHAFLLINLSH